MIIEASAPGRSGIIGNPSDIYGGVVVACSIPARATCRLTLDVESSLPEDPTLWKAATARFPLENVRVQWQSDIPHSSGLAGSTALLAATLACVLEAKGEKPASTAAFAELVRDVERYEAGVMCGYQDAYMAVHGGLQRMDFAGKHPVHPGPPASLESIWSDLPFLLITTGVKRLSGSVHAPIVDRWLAGGREVREALGRIGELGRLGAEALTSKDWPGLGMMMDENQRLTASLGGSGDTIDALIADCKKAGALGAKLAGAGLGGTVIALSMDLDDLEKRLRKKGYSQFMRPEISVGVELSQLPA